MTYRPPKNDRERLQNLVEALAEPTDGDDAFDQEMRAELKKRGLTYEQWAAQIAARAGAASTQGPQPAPTAGEPRVRRMRRIKIGAAVAAGLLATAAGAVVVWKMRELKDGADPQQSIQSMPPVSEPDAGRGSRMRK